MLKDLGFFRWILLLGHSLFLAGLLLSYVSPFIDSGKYWYLALPGLAHFWLLLVNFCFSVLWIFLRWKIAIIGFIVIAIGFPYHTRAISLFSGKTEIKGEPVKLMTYNVQLFKLYNWTKNKQLRDEMLEYIVSEKCDILCFQEYFYAPGEYFNTTDTLREIQQARNVHFEAGVTQNGNHQFGLATFSRYPIVGKGLIKFAKGKNRTNMAIYTDLKINKDTIRVYNVHLASNHLDTKQVDDILEGNEHSWKLTRSWLKKLRNGYRLRARQIQDIIKSIRTSPHPVIVCGDFNDVPVSYTYQQMSKGLKDAFKGSGNGLGATYNGKLPNLRIDYILHSPSIGSSGFEVEHKNFTDHFPVTCNLSVTSTKE